MRRSHPATTTMPARQPGFPRVSGLRDMNSRTSAFTNSLAHRLAATSIPARSRPVPAWLSPSDVRTCSAKRARTVSAVVVLTFGSSARHNAARMARGRASSLASSWDSTDCKSSLRFVGSNMANSVSSTSRSLQLETHNRNASRQFSVTSYSSSPGVFLPSTTFPASSRTRSARLLLGSWPG